MCAYFCKQKSCHIVWLSACLSSLPSKKPDGTLGLSKASAWLGRNCASPITLRHQLQLHQRPAIAASSSGPSAAASPSTTAASAGPSAGATAAAAAAAAGASHAALRSAAAAKPARRQLPHVGLVLYQARYHPQMQHDLGATPCC